MLTGCSQNFSVPFCVANESRGTYFSLTLALLCLSVTLFPSSSTLTVVYSLWLITNFQRHGSSPIPSPHHLQKRFMPSCEPSPKTTTASVLRVGAVLLRADIWCCFVLKACLLNFLWCYRLNAAVPASGLCELAWQERYNYYLHIKAYERHILAPQAASAQK